jgi:hypothetical protein
MGKYDPLRDYLASRDEALRELEMSFAETEKLVGKLPRSARMYRAWWANSNDARAEAQAWRSAGWHVRSVDLSAERVTFARYQGDDEHAIEGANAARAESSKSKSRTVLIADLGVGIVAAVGAGVSSVVGLTHMPWLVLLLLSAVLGGLGFTLTQAIGSRRNVYAALLWWRVSTLTILLLLVGAYTYHRLLDPANAAPRSYQFVVDGGQAEYIPLYGEPGGPAESLETGSAGQKGLIGGESYGFDCWTTARNGTKWLRYERYGQTWWAPRFALHPPFGEHHPPVPHC